MALERSRLLNENKEDRAGTVSCQHPIQYELHDLINRLFYLQQCTGILYSQSPILHVLLRMRYLNSGRHDSSSSGICMVGA